jgi:hypothetical protein
VSPLSFQSGDRESPRAVRALSLRETPEQYEPEETRQAMATRRKAEGPEGRKAMVKKKSLRTYEERVVEKIRKCVQVYIQNGDKVVSTRTLCYILNRTK